MSIQYVDKNADAVSTLSEPYAITGSNNQFSINVDGGSTQTVSLTTGSARTAANIVSDLTSLTGCTASVVIINGFSYVRIRTTSASGLSSSILFNAPSNHSNTILGFTATTYSGGANISYGFPATSAQSIANGIETGLTNAGWICISGSGSTDILMQSSMSPANQNLRMRLRLNVVSSNCQLSIQNTSGGLVGTNSSSCCMSSTIGQSFTIVANKYQAFVMMTGNASTKMVSRV